MSILRRERPRRALILVGALILASVLLWSYLHVPADPSISQRLARKAADPPGSVFQLSDVMPHSWTEAFIIPPYTRKQDAEKLMRRRWNHPWGSIATRDDRVLLIVFDGPRLVAAVLHTYEGGILSDRSISMTRLTPANARLRVARRAQLMTGRWVGYVVRDTSNVLSGRKSG
jgi:hypothetical protein